MAQSCILPVATYLFEPNAMSTDFDYKPIKVENEQNLSISSSGSAQSAHKMQRLVKNGRTLCSQPNCGRVARGREGLCQRHLSPDKKPKCRKCHKNCPQVAGSLCVKCSGREYPKRSKGSRKRSLTESFNCDQLIYGNKKQASSPNSGASSPTSVKAELFRSPSLTTNLWDYYVPTLGSDLLGSCLSLFNGQQIIFQDDGFCGSLPTYGGSAEFRKDLYSYSKAPEVSQCHPLDSLTDVENDNTLFFLEAMSDADLAEIAMSLSNGGST